MEDPFWVASAVRVIIIYFITVHIPLGIWNLLLFKSVAVGGLPPRQQDLRRRHWRLLSSKHQQQEGHVLWHQPVQQPCALLGSPAHHLPLCLPALRHPAGQLQEEVERASLVSTRKRAFVNECVTVLTSVCLSRSPTLTFDPLPYQTLPSWQVTVSFIHTRWTWTLNTTYHLLLISFQVDAATSHVA